MKFHYKIIFIFNILLVLSILIFILYFLKDNNEHFENKNYKFSLINGIGDRLLDIIGYSVLSKNTNIKGFMDWRNPYDNRVYDINVFNFDKLKKEVEWNNDNNDNEYTNTVSGITMTPYSVYKILNEKVNFKELVDLYIHYASLIELNEEIAQYIPSYLDKCTAIHLRRTDKINDYTSSFTANNNETDIIMKRIIDYINNDINMNEESNYYILSDDPEYLETFRNNVIELGKKHNKKVNIYILTEKEIPETILKKYKGAFSGFELFCMSKCKAIIQGTKHTNYSLLASLISQKPLYNFNDYTNKWVLLLWKPCLNLYIQDKHYDHIIDMNELKNTFDSIH